MTKPQFTTLACFDERWRSATNLVTFRGADLSDLEYLLKHGLVEMRPAGDGYYRITPAGRDFLTAQGIETIARPLVKRRSKGGWNTCRHRHRFQGASCTKCRGQKTGLQLWWEAKRGRR